MKGRVKGMKIALCQFNIRYEEKEENLARAENFIQQAASDQAAMILFPEMSFTGFSMNTQLTGEEREETLEAMRKLARREGIAIGFGWVKGKSSAENHYTIVDENGEVLEDYVKIHPFSYSGEDSFFVKGSRPGSFVYKGIPFGVSICYDLRFPELYQHLSGEAHVILVPANWPKRRRLHWRSLLQARAIENQVYMIGINCCGRQGDLYYSGNSGVVSAQGEVLFEIEDREELRIFELNDDVSSCRMEFPVKADRRPSLYKEFYVTVQP